MTFNCHCHSCVSACKAIEAKDGFSGTSIKSDELGGVAVAIWKSNNLTIEKADASKIDFVKVGDDGKAARSYCTECKTVLFNAFCPNWAAPNRNAIIKANGEVAFDPNDKLPNVMCKYAFDNAGICKPKHGSIPIGMLLKFIGLISGVEGDGSNANEKALIPEDMSKVEVVPITWKQGLEEKTHTCSAIAETQFGRNIAMNGNITVVSSGNDDSFLPTLYVANRGGNGAVYSLEKKIF